MISNNEKTQLKYEKKALKHLSDPKEQKEELKKMNDLYLKNSFNLLLEVMYFQMMQNQKNNQLLQTVSSEVTKLE